MAVALVVGLRAVRGREPTADDLEAILVAYELEHVGRATDEDLREVLVVRERLESVFRAAGEPAVAELLNGLVADAEVRPELTDHDGTWHLHYAPKAARLSQRVAATAAMALATVVAEHGATRLKVCGSESCADVFVDRSRNQSRRYCSDRCANRENVAAHRARRRLSSAARPPG
jgi:predicted RNA-binding Zn ribbon-like protein